MYMKSYCKRDRVKKYALKIAMLAK